jgi:hypothetical protein
MLVTAVSAQPLSCDGRQGKGRGWRNGQWVPTCSIGLGQQASQTENSLQTLAETGLRTHARQERHARHQDGMLLGSPQASMPLSTLTVIEFLRVYCA